MLDIPQIIGPTFGSCYSIIVPTRPCRQEFGPPTPSSRTGPHMVAVVVSTPRLFDPRADSFELTLAVLRGPLLIWPFLASWELSSANT